MTPPMALGRVVGSLLRRRFVLSPSAHRDVLAEPGLPGAWSATGAEPALDLAPSGTRLPRGWVRLSMDMEVTSGDSALGWLRADQGRVPEAVVSIPVPPPAAGRIDEFVRLPDVVQALRYDPVKGVCGFTLGEITAQELGWPEVFVRRMIRYCRSEGLTPAKAVRAALTHVRTYGVGGLWTWMSKYVDGEYPDVGYGPWARAHGAITSDGLRALEAAAGGLPWRPKFSIVMPVYNTPARWLRKAVDSVLAQAYDNWELCICDDHSSHAHVRPLLESYRRADPRVNVVYRSDNGQIAAATNDAMSLMTGEYMCLMDHDDVLTQDALYEFARALNEDRNIDLLYSDEDRINIDDVPHDPIVKPAWSPEYLETHMYLGHLSAYRVEAARSLGGFRPRCNGAQDYDFALRFTEEPRRVRHIPKILYHWRSVPGSIAASIEGKEYALAAAKRALEDRLARENSPGTVVEDRVKGWFRVRRDPLGAPSVSVILSDDSPPGTAGAWTRSTLAAKVASIRSKSTYGNVEFLAAGVATPSHPAGSPPEIPELRCVAPAGDGSNRAANLNAAAQQAGGDFLVFLSGDADVDSGDWLENMLRLAQRPGVGVVGAKLLFGDRTLRHVGFTFVDGLPRHIRRGYPESDWGRNGSSAVDRNYLAVSGACMLVGREDLAAAGGFDPALAPALHDVDLCLRMVDRGLRVVLAPAAVLLRRGTEDRDFPPAEDAAELFKSRWMRLVTPDPYYGANLSLRPPTFEFRPTDGR